MPDEVRTKTLSPARRNGETVQMNGVPARMIGESEEGRPIGVVHLGRPDAPLRILVLAGQHGDEPHARTAVADFAARLSGELREAEPVALAVLANLNPDGSAADTRKNARGVDLNRDHALLESIETQALHRFVRRFRPHLVVDAHTYPPRRKHLLENDLIYCHDVFLDVANNPGVYHPVLAGPGRQFLAPVTSTLSALNCRAARYTIINDSGRVRHSTPDVVDVRNSLALRYGCFTVLVEGRRPARSDRAGRYPGPVKAISAALQAILAWAAQHQSLLTLPSAPLRATEWITIRSRYARAVAPRAMDFEDAASGAIRPVTLPGKYTPHLESTRRVRLPLAYAVPNACEALLKVLSRHGFPNYPGRRDRIRRVERTWIENVRHSPRKRRAPRKIVAGMSRERRALPGYTLFPVTEATGPALAVFLEAESKYGLHRFEAVDLAVKPRASYPILRVIC